MESVLGIFRKETDFTRAPRGRGTLLHGGVRVIIAEGGVPLTLLSAEGERPLGSGPEKKKETTTLV